MTETTELEPADLDARTLRAIRGTRWWVQLIGRIAIAIAALLVVTALLTLAVSFFGDGAPGTTLALMTVLLAVPWVIPGIRLHRFARALGRVEDGASSLEDAMREQHGLWRMIGIIFLVIIGTYVILPVIVMIALWLRR